MSAADHRPVGRPVPALSAVRHHLVLVLTCLALGALAGWAYTDSSPTRYSSDARVLVNPALGNPYAPTPSSVRQDELTSLQTEAELARSTEVLRAAADAVPEVDPDELGDGAQVTVLTNTQILEISYTSTDPEVARDVAQALARAYLANRTARFEEVKDRRVRRVETQTNRVIDDLRSATAASQSGSPSRRAFQAELADALRNELVSLRSQRSTLEGTEAPVGVVVSPASTPATAGTLQTLLLIIGGGLVGLALGCVLAVLLERLRGTVRTPSATEDAGLPVLAAVPRTPWHARLRGRRASADVVATTVRRMRTTLLAMEPRPRIISVAPAGSGGSDASASEAVAESFAKGGHPVVLVRPDHDAGPGGLAAGERGLAEALTFERLNVRELLQPSVEPLVSLLNAGGMDSESRELLVADRLRAVLSPLADDGHVVVIQAPGTGSPDGDVFMCAADLTIVVVTRSRTRRKAVQHIVALGHDCGARVATLVIGRGDLAHRRGRGVPDKGVDRAEKLSVDHDETMRSPRT